MNDPCFFSFATNKILLSEKRFNHFVYLFYFSLLGKFNNSKAKVSLFESKI